MGTGYTRNDSSNNIADGNVINASDLGGEYDAIESAFGTSGHQHDGTSGEGGVITVLGPAQDFVVSASEIKPKTDNTLDIGTSSLEFKNLYLDGLAYIDGLGETMLVSGSSSIQFRDTALSINSSTDGQLDIDADTELEITAPTVDINASTVVNISTDLIVGDDLTLQSDAAVLNFGADSDVSLTHVADTGLLLNGASAIQFRDAALAINSSADGQLDIIADTQLEITTPTLELNSDAQIIAIGADGDVTITHEADTGLKMKAASGFELNLQTGDTSVESGNVLGKITFNAPSESSGSDAILDGAAIEAVSEGTFSSTVNTTKLSFKTGASEAATEKMSLSSAGALSVTGVVTANAGVVVDNITIDGNDISTTDTNGNLTITPNGTGDLQVNSDRIKIRATEGESATLVLAADEDDDDGDTYKLIANTDNTFVIQNDVSGSADVTHFSITPADPVTNSVAAFAGKITAASTINGVGISYNISNFSESMLISNDAGTGTLSTATGNTGFGHEVFDDLTSGDNNTAMGHESGDALTSGSLNTFVGSAAGGGNQSSNNNTAIGAFAFDAGTGADNTAVGSGALGGGSNSGADNVAIGLDAGNSISSGINNTLIGSHAGDAFNTGGSNVAIGFEALTTDVKGSYSVAVGNYALNAQTFATDTNVFNTAVGYNAGAALTSGVQNTLIGARAGDSLTDADFNVAVGKYALTEDRKGNRSTAIGYGALYAQNFASSTDSSNTAVGYGAGTAVTTGINNTLIGGGAGDALTDADFNVALGTYALTEDTVGSKSTAIGYYSLGNQTFGSTATDTHNTAVGYHAGLAVTTGVQNTLVGSNAGDALTDADYNVSVGAYTLSTDTMGSKSTAIGYATLNNQNFSTATDSFNTAVGYYAGLSLTTGVKNTIIGAGAGDALTAEDHNTLIGYEAGGGLTTGRLNTVVGSIANDNDLKGWSTVAIGVGAFTTQQFNSGADENNQTNNTGVGYYAGGLNQSGKNNTYIGSLAGDDCIDGNNNTAIGYGTLSADHGDNNTAVGAGAGAGLGSGADQNTFVGSECGDSTDDGEYNSALGYQALSANCGDENTAMGRMAGVLITGSENTCFGDGAGATITSGSQNVCLGHDAGVNQISTSSNLLYIARTGAAAGNDQCWIHGTDTGTCINGDNSTAWAQTSDKRIKKNITDSSVGLTEINKLKIRNFEYRTFEELDSDVKALNDGKGLNVISKSGTKTGVIAQEVEEVFPNDVQEMGDGTKIVTPSDLNYALIKAVQELSAKITSLEAEVTKLKGE